MTIPFVTDSTSGQFNSGRIRIQLRGRGNKQISIKVHTVLPVGSSVTVQKKTLAVFLKFSKKIFSAC